MKALRVNLFVGTPCYNSMLHSDYLHSVISFYEKSIPFAVMTLGNESLITRGRNTILSYFHKAENFTHLLFLDADIHLPGEGLIRLLAHEKDVIGAPVPLKGYDGNSNSVFNVGKLIEEKENGLSTVERVGTAVFMLSRKAVDALVQYTIDNNDVYKSNPYTRGDAENMDVYDIFKVGVVNGEYLSEDYFVCHTLRELGFDVFVDTNVPTKHNGMYVFQ